MSAPTVRFVCTSPECGHLMPVVDDDPAAGRACERCGRWSSLTTSPVGRWAAHRHGIELPEAAAFCRYDFVDATKPTGIAVVDLGGVRICPNRADSDDGLCTFHRGAEAAPATLVQVPAEPAGDRCDWCLTVPADGRPLRPVPGQRVVFRELRVCSGCVAKVLPTRASA